MNRIFVYGTLLIPAVMEAVTGKTFAFEHATLPGYARYRIKGQTFPGITRVENRHVKGIIYKAVDEPSLHRLDDFESDVYYRGQVKVTLENGRRVSAHAYIMAPDHAGLLTDQHWDLEQFIQDHLCSYIKQMK